MHYLSAPIARYLFDDRFTHSAKCMRETKNNFWEWDEEKKKEIEKKKSFPLEIEINSTKDRARLNSMLSVDRGKTSRKMSEKIFFRKLRGKWSWENVNKLSNGHDHIFSMRCGGKNYSTAIYLVHGLKKRFLTFKLKFE